MMSKRILFAVAVLLFAVNFPILAQTTERSNEIKSSIVTLYARDPLAQSFCFRDGDYGNVFQEGQKRNRCSHLNFDSYQQSSFSVGVQGGEKGVIVDLGTPDELQKKYGYEETVGKGQGFASISVKNNKAYILQDYRANTRQEIAESSLLFQKPERNLSSVSVKLGHIYLLRITGHDDKNPDIFVKLLVIGYLPDESVTVRWQVLSNEIKQEN